MAQLTIADDESELARLAAERLTQLIEGTVAARGTAFVSLTGGTTPRRLYATLADAREPWRDRIAWSQIHFFWGDERHVPSEHPDSNYGMAKATLLDHVPVRPDHVHRIRAELPDAREAAAEYDRQLDLVASASTHGSVASGSAHSSVASAFRRKEPFFDLMLLGVGEDAHIASIFPGWPGLAGSEPPRRVAAVWASHLGAWRITLTPDAILDSRAIVVLASGENKAHAVRAALEEPLDVTKYPAQLLRAAGDRVEWFLDRAAASHT
jgi:6-phosphogluconolactonase